MKRKSRICIISSVHPTFDTRIFHRQAGTLAGKGFEVIYITPAEKSYVTSEGIDVRGIAGVSGRIRRVLSQWRYLAAALHSSADLYHFHDPELIPIALLLRVLTRKPVIYDVHEHYPDAIRLKEWIRGHFPRQVTAMLFDVFERISASFFSAIITADDAVRDRFARTGRPVVVLFNFPQKRFFENVMPRTQPRKSRVRLICVGCISPERGQWLMLDIVRMLATEYRTDVGLVLAGPFDSSIKKEEFLRVVKEDDTLRGRVDWLGVAPQQELPALLASSDIGLVPLQPVPKFNSNIPTKLFEYMAAGLPIVASDLPPIRQFIDESRAGLLAIPGDPRSFVEAILSISHDHNHADALGAKGREAFLSKYNWTREEPKMIELYAELIGSGERVDGRKALGQ